MKEIKMFMAYATEDEEYKEQLSKHLSALKEEGYISEWTAGEILPGADVMHDLRKKMSQCDIIALLLSADFVGSDHGVELEEMAFAMKAKKGTRLVPIKIRACMLSDAYAQFSMLPDQSKPVDDPTWGSRDNAYMNIAEGIKKLAQSMRDEEERETRAEAKKSDLEKAAKEYIDPQNSMRKTTPKPSGSEKKMSVGIKAIIGVILTILLAVAIWQLMPKTDKDAQAYTIAKQAHTIEAYKSYLGEFPEGAFVTEANANIAIMKEAADKIADAAAWEKAKNADNLTNYAYYIENYPNGDSVEVAKQKRDFLSGAEADKIIWNKATAANNVPAYVGYINDYGKEGRHHDEAVSAIKLLLKSDGWAYYGEINSSGQMNSDRFFDVLEGDFNAKPKVGDLIKSKKAITLHSKALTNSSNKGVIKKDEIAEIIQLEQVSANAFWAKIEHQK